MSEEEVSSSVTSHVIQDKLSPGSTYTLRMLSKNSYGRGAVSPSVRFTTKSEVPSMPPTDISAESMGATVIVIKWKPPPKDHWNGQLKGYRVGYRLLSSYKTTTSFTASSSSSDSYSSSDSISSAESVEKTDASEIVASPSSSESVVIPSQMTSALSFFPPTNDPSLMDKLYSMKEVPISAVISSEEQQLILTGLSKATTYSIIVQAFNEAGMGPFSQQVIVSTSFNGKSLFRNDCDARFSCNPIIIGSNGSLLFLPRGYYFSRQRDILKFLISESESVISFTKHFDVDKKKT
jgi:hypothetical protein